MDCGAERKSTVLLLLAGSSVQQVQDSTLVQPTLPLYPEPVPAMHTFREGCRLIVRRVGLQYKIRPIPSHV